jgi:nucleoside-diphosphate-sugar epimerase
VLPIRRQAPAVGAALVVQDLAGIESQAAALAGCDALVHLAGLAHVTEGGAQAGLPYREVNALATAAVARAARAAGVGHVVYVSSAGVHGNASKTPFTERDAPAPYDAYTASKYEGERLLQEALAGSQTRWTVVRPPMVVGPDAPGNLGRLLSMLGTGLPLPLASIRNRRSYVGQHNLCDFLICCLQSLQSSGETYLVADEPAVSTPELIRLLGEVSGRRARLLPFPPALLRTLLKLAGRERDWTRLSASFELDARHARDSLGWTPPHSLRQTLARAFTPH